MFGDKCPQNGSKNDPMAPKTTLECPNEGPSEARVDDLLRAAARLGESSHLAHVRLPVFDIGLTERV
jgi:hypothetical protein